MLIAARLNCSSPSSSGAIVVAAAVIEDDGEVSCNRTAFKVICASTARSIAIANTLKAAA
jgi:hypothetical protein